MKTEMCNKKVSLSESFESAYADFKATFKETSEYEDSNGNKRYLVENQDYTHCFDKIVEYHCGQSKGYSVDAIEICGNTIILIEFKTGFKDNITLNNFNNKYNSYCPDGSHLHCASLGEYLFNYYDKHFKYRSAVKEDLLKILELKLIESIAFLKKYILPKLDFTDEPIFKYVVVTDSLYVKQKDCTINEVNLNFLKDNNWDPSKCTHDNTIFKNPKNNVLIEEKLSKYTSSDRKVCDEIIVIKGDNFSYELSKIKSP